MLIILQHRFSLYTWEMTNLKDDLNSWMSAVKRFTSCPVLLASKKATSCLRGKVTMTALVAVSNNHDCMRSVICTSVRMRKASFSCPLPLSPQPERAGWCSRLSAGPAQWKECISTQHILMYFIIIIRFCWLLMKQGHFKLCSTTDFFLCTYLYAIQTEQLQGRTSYLIHIVPSLVPQVPRHNIHQIPEHQGDLNVQDRCSKSKLRRKIFSLAYQQFHHSLDDMSLSLVALPQQPPWEPRAEVWQIPTGYAIWIRVEVFWRQLPAGCCCSRLPRSTPRGRTAVRRPWAPLVPGWTSGTLPGVWMSGWQTDGQLSGWGATYDWRHDPAVVRSCTH